MTDAPLTELEVRLLARLRCEPRIIADLAPELRLPVPAVEALLHRLRREGLVEVRPAGRPPVQTWQVVA